MNNCEMGFHRDKRVGGDGRSTKFQCIRCSRVRWECFK